MTTSDAAGCVAGWFTLRPSTAHAIGDRTLNPALTAAGRAVGRECLPNCDASAPARAWREAAARAVPDRSGFEMSMRTVRVLDAAIAAVFLREEASNGHRR